MRETTRKLTSEKLEKRQLMAADISFAHGDLTIDMSESGRRDLRVGNAGAYVWIEGNGNLSIHSPNRIAASDVIKLTVIGSNKADDIDLSRVGHFNFPNLRSVLVDAGEGHDKVIGSHLADRIYGGNGNDWIDGFAGNDYIYGQRGNDTLFGGGGSDHLYGGKGNDRIWGASYHQDDNAIDYIFGGSGVDVYDPPNPWSGKKDRLRGIERVEA